MMASMGENTSRRRPLTHHSQRRDRGLHVRREIRAASPVVGPPVLLVRRTADPAKPRVDESDGLSNKAFLTRDYRKLYANLPRLKTSSVTIDGTLAAGSGDDRPHSAADAGANRVGDNLELIERAERR